jgi:glycerol-3-phosphate dehydrogenase subunit B
MQVIGADTGQGRLQRVWSEAAGRPRAHAAHHFVLATGGILGGGLKASPDGVLEELIFRLPVRVPQDRSAWLAPDFLAPNGHPLYRAGVAVDDYLRPVDYAGRVIYPNLSAAGAVLSGSDPVWERSVEGIALTTGFAVGERIYAELQSLSG